MQFAQGKIVMALEGGYNLTSLANSVLACVKTLLEEKTINGSLRDYPFESTWRVIQQVKCFPTFRRFNFLLFGFLHMAIPFL